MRAEGPQGSTGGVIIFTRGKVFGGDSGFYYIGNYQEASGIVKARIAVHNFDPTVTNILNISKDYELDVSGTVSGDTISGTAAVPGIPNQSMALHLTRKANL